MSFKKATLLIIISIILFFNYCKRETLQISIPSPPPLPEKKIPPVQIWDGFVIDSLALVSSISFPQIKGELPYSIDSTIIKALNRSGIKIVPPNFKCPTKLSIVITGRAINAYYLPGGKLYTGGEIKGKLTLSSNGRKPITFPINAYEPADKVISIISEELIERWGKPEGYRFKDLWLEPVLDFLCKVWGPSVFVWLLDEKLGQPDKASSKLSEAGPTEEVMNNIYHALYSQNDILRSETLDMFRYGGFAPKAPEAIPYITHLVHDKNDDIKLEAIEVLEIFGPLAIESVPSLIIALSYTSYNNWISKSASDALKIITGRLNFYDDVEIWKRWWFKNKRNIEREEQ